jgi:cardiolipin synthase
VYLEMYIFTNDMVQYDFLNLLKEKAESGLRVRIVLDSFGSSDLGDKAVAELQGSGAEVVFLNNFIYHNHRKILVVDENVAFIGGVNLSQEFRFWRDLVVEVKSKKLVHHIIRSFAKIYAECGGKDALILLQNKRIVLDKTHTWLVEHFPSRKKATLKKIYKEHIGKAQKKIVLVAPYFMPKHWLIRTLRRAVLRGVQVEVLVSKTTGVFIIDRVNYFYIFKLSKLGINFYIAPQINHAKVMILDSKEGIVGSQNLDFLSFDLNNEIGVFLKDASAVRQLEGIVEDWKKEATFFDFKTYQPKWFDYVLSPLISIFFKVLSKALEFY